MNYTAIYESPDMGYISRLSGRYMWIRITPFTLDECPLFFSTLGSDLIPCPLFLWFLQYFQAWYNQFCSTTNDFNTVRCAYFTYLNCFYIRFMALYLDRLMNYFCRIGNNRSSLVMLGLNSSGYSWNGLRISSRYLDIACGYSYCRHWLSLVWLNTLSLTKA